MDGMTTVRIELGINAQQLTQQMMIHNRNLEEALQKGIERGLSELLENENFEAMVAEQTKSEVQAILSGFIWKHEFVARVRQILSERINDKLNAYCERIADSIVKGLDEV